MDTYTKVIFTVIAGALTALAIENAGGRVMADNGGLARVAICDPINRACVGVATSSQDKPADGALIMVSGH
jgi:hypothetical protein